MSEREDRFPALTRAKHLSEFLCEGELHESPLTPEEEEAAGELQNKLLHLLQNVPPDKWPKLSDVTEKEPQEVFALDGTRIRETAP